jgi:hypothetical protein
MPGEVKSSFDQERKGREGSLTRMAIINDFKAEVNDDFCLNTSITNVSPHRKPLGRPD